MEDVPVVPVDPMEVLAQIRRTLRWLVVATAVLFIALVGGVVYVYVTVRATNDALCALRADLQTRVDSSKDFLIEHPNGIPGVSPKTIKDGIKNQERTIDALSDLPCPSS